MSTDKQQKVNAILRILALSGQPLGSRSIATELQASGIDVKERMVRNYLVEMDHLGLTENVGRSGRRITRRGIAELQAAIAVQKVGFVSARVDELSYKMTFDRVARAGTVVMNLSRIRARDLPVAQRLIRSVLDAGLGMGNYVAIGREGEELGGYVVPPGRVVVGTLCSVTLNGVFRAAGIPMTSRFGGLLEMRNGNPFRVTQIINYDGTTVDPVVIFMKGKMTRVRDVMNGKNGTIGVGFREIPAAALPEAERLIEEMIRIGLLGKIRLLGKPGQPLLDVPVAQGRVGIILAAGLNALAAVEEAGIETENHAMASLQEFETLVPAGNLAGLLQGSRKAVRSRGKAAPHRIAKRREFGIFE